jgi:hypothetical protein
LHFETCDAEQTWWRELDDWFVDEGFLGFSPNGGLLVRTTTHVQGRAVRVLDGEQVFSVHQRLQSGAVDPAWRVHAEIVQEGRETRVALKQLVTGLVLQSAPVGSGAIPGAALSGDLSRALVSSCDGETLVVQAWSLETGNIDVVAEIEEGCGGFDWYPTLPMSLSHDGRTALVASRVGGNLITIDVESGQWSSVTAHLFPEESQFSAWGGVLLSAELSPDGTRAVTAGVGGRVRVWDLRDLSMVAEFSSRAVMLNLDSYQPRAGSAVSWSPDGRLLAHLDENGDVVVRRSSDWTVVTSIARPALEDGENFRGEEYVVNAPVQFAWNDSVTGLAISFDRGMALWQCGAPDVAAEPHGLSVELEGPAQGRVGQALEFTATHLGEAHLHGHTFLLNGELLAQGTTLRGLEWTPEVAGLYEITVVVEDGVSDGTAAVFVEVR